MSFFAGVKRAAVVLGFIGLIAVVGSCDIIRIDGKVWP